MAFDINVIKTVYAEMSSKIDNARKIQGINQVLYCNDSIYENPIAENLSILI